MVFSSENPFSSKPPSDRGDFKRVACRLRFPFDLETKECFHFLYTHCFNKNFSS